MVSVFDRENIYGDSSCAAKDCPIHGSKKSEFEQDTIEALKFKIKHLENTLRCYQIFSKEILDQLTYLRQRELELLHQSKRLADENERLINEKNNQENP